MSAALHRNTPTLSVIDSRGLPVRQVAYLRTVENDEPQARITRQQRDAAGRAVAQWDPRLFGKVANLASVYSQSAAPLQLTKAATNNHILYVPTVFGIPLRYVSSSSRQVNRVINHGETSPRWGRTAP